MAVPWRRWLAALRRTRLLGRLGLSNTRRAAVLAIVMCALALSVAVPLRTYFSQRSQIAEQTEQQEQLRVQVAKLERRNQQLADPEQTKAEARKRLRYVLPGETPYLVQLPQDGAAPAAPPKPEQRKQNEKSWYANLWNSINK
ncbi:FtsB family cell division protein [Sciscionella sediminilitoris]|uniref:FtsB family cell division protein n=1 Tax=Sciscionella sediminilitoris TaxID=1445613 RepID=UPI0004DF4457|nr:septum formation initiator family protein [Sciscionella sp. SE31]